MGAGKRIIRRAALISLLGFVAFAGATSADASDLLLQERYLGVSLQAVAPPPGKQFDTTLLDAKEGLARIKAALDRLVSRSPHSAQRLNLLLASGRVVLVYRPDDLKNLHGGENVATFLPDFRVQSPSARQQKVFFVVIGRHGVKWPVNELAATLAHELSGHAMQHQRGWLSTTRHLDAECEANLHEEIANQELGLDKHSRRSVAFRQALENHWCSDFKAYMRAHRPDATALWEQRDPDIPALLAIFERYKQHSARTGESARAIDALKRQSRERRRRAFRDASPEMLLQMARKLRDGGIGVRPDQEEAFRYFRLAAQSGQKTAAFGSAHAMPKISDGATADSSVFSLTAPPPFGSGFGKSEHSQQR